MDIKIEKKKYLVPTAVSAVIPSEWSWATAPHAEYSLGAVPYVLCSVNPYVCFYVSCLDNAAKLVYFCE